VESQLFEDCLCRVLRSRISIPSPAVQHAVRSNPGHLGTSLPPGTPPGTPQLFAYDLDRTDSGNHGSRRDPVASPLTVRSTTFPTTPFQGRGGGSVPGLGQHITLHGAGEGAGFPRLAQADPVQREPVRDPVAIRSAGKVSGFGHRAGRHYKRATSCTHAGRISPGIRAQLHDDSPGELTGIRSRWPIPTHHYKAGQVPCNVSQLITPHAGWLRTNGALPGPTDARRASSKRDPRVQLTSSLDWTHDLAASMALGGPLGLQLDGRGSSRQLGNDPLTLAPSRGI